MTRVVLATLFAVVGLLGIPGRADAAGGFFDCVDAGNVWVVINYKGSITQGCAKSPTYGIDALNQLTEVNHNGSGMIVQIGGNPATIDSNVNIYWNYFHMDKAGDTWGPWKYSSLGAGNYKPKPGSVEGWTYGATGTQVNWSPPARPAPTTQPPNPTTKPPAVTTAPQTTATTRPTQSSATRSTSAATTSESTPSAADTPSPSQSDSPSPTPSPTGSATASPEASAATTVADIDRGSPVATIATLAVVSTAAAGGAGWWLLRGRRPTP